MKQISLFLIIVLLVPFLNSAIVLGPSSVLAPVKASGVGNGLVAYWNLDEGSGTVAHDSSGNGNDGILFDGPTWVSGKSGGALSFDGVDDYVNVTKNTDLDPHTSDWTISAWVNIGKLGSPPNYHFVIAGKRQTEFDSSLTLMAGWGTSESSEAYFGFIFDGHNQQAGARSVLMNVFGWHYVAGVRRGGNLYVYVDGVEYGPNNYLNMGTQLTADTDVSSSTPFQLAHHGAWASYYNGTIDEVRVYSVALTQQEIVVDMHANGASAPVYFSETGNYYEAVSVPNGLTWNEALNLAEVFSYLGVQGHLATVTSRAENDFIINNLGGPVALNRYWLGGFQPSGSPEPAGGWQWVTGELWNYTNWSPGEPSNRYGGEFGGPPAGTDEDVLQFWANSGQWNDMAHGSYQPGLIIEYDVERASANGLVGYWKFDEGSGSTAADSSGMRNTGMLYNGSTWVGGRFGQTCLSFDGASSYVQVEDSSSLEVTTQITVEAWVYPRTLTDNRGYDSHIISKCDFNGDHRYVLGTDSSGKWHYSVYTAWGYDLRLSTAAVSLNKWTHLAMTYNGSAISLYINDELDSSYAQSGPILTTSAPLGIGGKLTPEPIAFFNGLIDEARIYNRALGQQEIQADMDQGGPSYPNILVVQNNEPSLWYMDYALNQLAIPHTNIKISEIAATNLSAYQVILVGSSIGYLDDVKPYLDAAQNDIEAWVANGGSLFVEGQFVGGNGFDLKGNAVPQPGSGYYGWVPGNPDFKSDPGGNAVHIVFPTHPLVENLTDASLSGWDTAPNGYFDSYPGQVIDVQAGYLSRTALFVYGFGKGIVIGSSLNADYHTHYNGRGEAGISDSETFLGNVVNYCSYMVALESAYGDEFGGAILNPAWTWIDSVGDCNYSLTANPGCLRILVPSEGHDLYPSTNYNAPRAMQVVDGDFAVETKVSLNPQHSAQGAGILVWQGTDNYLRLERCLYGGGQVVDVSGVMGGTWSIFSQTQYLGTVTCLRLERIGNNFTAEYSTNGINWNLLCQMSFPFVDPLGLGLFVLNEWGPAPPVFADFDYFRLGNASRTNRLTVQVMNSSSLPVDNASVSTANITTFSDASGCAVFNLPFGSYNVTVSNQDYESQSAIVDLDQDKNITLTLSYPYDFEGEIANSSVILVQVQSGYNITLLNDLASSDMDIFFDWKYMGTIASGTWQSFDFDHLPNLVVEAASRGSSDYPKAWYTHPLPIQLTPTTGEEGGFLPEPVPYVAGSIFVIPYPPVYGQNTTIGATLHNPDNHTLHISRADFQISGLTVGGYFTSVAYLSDISLEANETRVLSINWNATVGGHHCIRVVLTYSPATQTMQRNIDIENDVIEGGTGEVTFSLVNPYETSQVMTIKVNKQLSIGSEATLEIDGRVYDTSSDIVIDVAPGQELSAVLKIKTCIALEDGIVDVEAYVNGQLIGGVRKTIKTVPPHPDFSITGLGGAAMGFESNDLYIEGTGWLPGSRVKLTQGEDWLNIVLGYATADEEGKFSGTYKVQSMGVVPIPTKISANADQGQSAWKLFAYLGNRDALLAVGECLIAVFPIRVDVLYQGVVILHDVPVSTILYKLIMERSIPIDAVVTAIATAITKLPIGVVLKCGGAIIGFVTGQYRHVDLLVQTTNGTIGTTGQGEYVNSMNDSWASGNNFNDAQLIFLPLTTNFNVTIDSTRAAFEVESYTMTVAFACGLANKTANKQFQGEIQNGTLATYEVSLENWTVSSTPLHNLKVAAVSSKSVVGQGYSVPINVNVENDGNSTEAFNVTAYTTLALNQTIVETEAITLTGGNSSTLTFIWNTTGFALGNYTVDTYASPVSGETDISDNNFTGVSVTVSIIGDITGATPSLLDFVPDGLVDMKDVGVLASFFLQSIPPASANCDITGPIQGLPDGIVDMMDIGTAAAHFLEHYP